MRRAMIPSAYVNVARFAVLHCATCCLTHHAYVYDAGSKVAVTADAREEGEAEEVEFMHSSALTTTAGTTVTAAAAGENWHEDSSIEDEVNDSISVEQCFSSSSAAVLQPASHALAVPELIEPILDALDVWLADDVLLYTKLCRVLAAALKAAVRTPAATTATAATAGAAATAEFVLVQHMMPALSLLTGSAASGNALWDALQHLRYEQRYAAYEDWGCSASVVGTVEGLHWKLCAARIEAIADIGDILK
jgi:THO complex subunit 2 N-terminus